MTQAYIAGFRKTAEAYGVDPDQLIKVAIPIAGLLAQAKQTGKVSEQLAKALTNVGRRAPRFGRMPKSDPTRLTKQLAQRSSGAARAQTAVGNFYRENGISQLSAKNPASKAQRFWANQLTHPDMTAPTGLEWANGGTIFRSGIEPSMHVGDLRSYLKS